MPTPAIHAEPPRTSRSLDSTRARALTNYYLCAANLSSCPTNSAATLTNRIIDLYDRREFFAARLANVNKASCEIEKFTARYISRQILGNAVCEQVLKLFSGHRLKVRRQLLPKHFAKSLKLPREYSLSSLLLSFMSFSCPNRYF